MADNFESAWAYDPSPADTGHVEIRERYGHFIAGAFVPPAEGPALKSFNPATGKVLCTLAEGTEEEVHQAVSAAKKAFDAAWQPLPAREKGKLLYRLAFLAGEMASGLAILETMDTGRPVRFTRDRIVPLAAAHLFYHAGWSDKLRFAFPGRSPVPFGVCGLVLSGPASFLMLVRKIAPALATGNCVVLKPSADASLPALKFAELCMEAGLPEGVVNVVTGSGGTGLMLAEHPETNLISFTGPPESGRRILKTRAGSGHRVLLATERCGADLVFEDAPLDQAVDGVVTNAFCGQEGWFSGGPGVLVQESVADLFLEKLLDRMQTLLTGDPLDSNTDVGPLGSRKQLEMVRERLRAAGEEGAKIVRHPSPVPDGGWFCRPAVAVNVSMSGPRAGDGIPGPVLIVRTFRTPAEAVRMAGDLSGGMPCSIWTANGSRAAKAAEEIRAGVIWCGNRASDPVSPFGGTGREREGGLHGLYHYVRTG